MSKNQRLAYLGIAAAILIAAVVLFAASGGRDDASQSTATTATTPEATATPTATTTTDGEATPAATPAATPEPKAPLLDGSKEVKLTFKEGDTVRFRVKSPVADEVHVHGYDIKKNVPAGQTATISFKATITGVFEIEFEGQHKPIASLKVEP